MTQDEVTLLFGKINTYYPRFLQAFGDESKIEMAIESWHELLTDIPFELAILSLKRHVLDSEKGQYMPSVADIRKHAIENSGLNTAAEAWGEVVKAVSEIGLRPYDKDSNKALDSLKPLTRKVTEAIGFRTICMAEEETVGVVRGQFLKMYDQISTKQKQDALLPEGLKNKIRELAELKGIKVIGDGRRT